MSNDDLRLIVGARAIGKALNLSTDQVNNARKNGGLKFIWKERGLGLVTSRRAVREYQEVRIRKEAASNAKKAHPRSS